MAVVVEVFIIRKAHLKEMRWCSKSSKGKPQDPERKIILEAGNLVLLHPEGRYVERGEFKKKQSDNAVKYQDSSVGSKE